jgi:phosphate transport system permease protein
MAAVPSVVFGLWGLLVLAPNLTGLYDHISSAVASIPVLKTLLARGPSGQSYFTAGLVLALMITPIITSLTREVFRTVPRNDKEGALALGATRWEMITGVVLPHSTGGIVGAVMLGLGRAMGETIAVALLIGGNARVFHSLFGPGDAMPSVIARNLGESSIYPYYREALIGLGVTLFALTIVVNIVGRRVVGRLDQRLRGAA